jgi:hypothetical protein
MRIVSQVPYSILAQHTVSHRTTTDTKNSVDNGHVVTRQR